MFDEKTMSLLTFSFYMLSEHPDIEKRLRQEIFEKVGRTGRPRYDQMREMKYMRAFLNGMYSQFCIVYNMLMTIFIMAEVLRLYPPVLVSLSLS
jgi:cytochrome P450